LKKNGDCVIKEEKDGETMTTESKGKIGVLIEEHFDPTEYRRFNEYFPQKGYEVEYISHLWSNSQLKFGSNPDNDEVEEHVIVKKEVNDIDPSEYKGIIAIGAYAMDRLRYQASVKKGEKNQAPAVAFIRKAMNTESLKIGTICHGLWLFCADSDLIKGRQVTCAHNIICDVENAGGDVIYDGDATADLVIDGNLITGKHPGVVDQFMDAFVEEIEKQEKLQKVGAAN
jgi:protease I